MLNEVKLYKGPKQYSHIMTLTIVLGGAFPFKSIPKWQAMEVFAFIVLKAFVNAIISIKKRSVIKLYMTNSPKTKNPHHKMPV